MHTIGFPHHDILIPNIIRTENASLFDETGKRYVDLESGVWCTPLGHSNPDVLRVIREQAATLMHVGYCYSTPVVEQAARRILSILEGGEGRCVFLCSGSEAIEYGLRTALMVAPRPKILALADSYFGAYGVAKGQQQDVWTSFDWTGCETCPHQAPCDHGCEQWERIPFHEIGVFLFEPGSSSGLVRFPPRKLIDALAERIHDEGGLLMANEVTTGIGRTGTWFGYQHYGFVPDITALGKGLGNGYPVSVSVLSEHVINALGEQPVMYAQSHQNDALGAAVALQVIDSIEENRLIERCKDISEVLLDGLNSLCQQFQVIHEVRGRGLMAAVEFAHDADPTLAKSLHGQFVEKGYILTHRPGSNVLRLDPCLTIDRVDIDGFLKTFADLLHAKGY